MSRFRNARLYQLGDKTNIFGDLHWLSERDRATLDALAVGDRSFTESGTAVVRLRDQRLQEIPRTAISGDCRCCGARSTRDDPVFRTNVRDADGEYYPRLCEPCFEDFEDLGYFDRPDDRLQIAVDLLGEDHDGIAMVFA